MNTKKLLQKRKKILITGANGFIGANIVKFLEKSGLFSTIPVLGPGGNEQGIQGTAIDILDFSKLNDFFQKEAPEIVIHTAGYVNLKRDFEVSILCVDANIKGTLNILEACRLNGVSKIIFPSSYEVYGDQKGPYSETMPVSPPSVYSISKLAGESMCNLYHSLYGLDYVILRISNVYGPCQSSVRLIPSVITKALAGENIEISGNNKRDFLYMEDLLDAFYLAVIGDLCNNCIVNIGSGIGTSIFAVAETIVGLLNSKNEIYINPQAKRVGESESMVQDISLAKNVLGWVPKNSLGEGLRKTIEYYKNSRGSS